MEKQHKLKSRPWEKKKILVHGNLSIGVNINSDHKTQESADVDDDVVCTIRTASESMHGGVRATGDICIGSNINMYEPLTTEDKEVMKILEETISGVDIECGGNLNIGVNIATKKNK